MSLLAPVFLAGLLAVVLPWWLHRLSRDNPPLQDFGSSMFLEARETTSSKQAQLRYKKLFYLRLLLLALLALLFAEPALKAGKLMGGSNQRQILIVDTSLSQQLGNRWARTIDLVNQQLDSASASDEILLVAANHQFQQLEGDNSVASAKGQLSQLTPSSTRLDYGQITAAIASLVEQSTLPVAVHVFTDVQATAMPARFSDLAVDGVDSLTIHPTTSANEANLSINGQLDYSADNAADVTVIVGNYSDLATEVTVELRADDMLLDQTRLTVGGNSNTAHRFTGVDTSSADGAIEARVNTDIADHDQLAEDNTWLIALPDSARTEVSLLKSSTLANRYAAAAIDSDPRYATRQLESENLSASAAGGLLIVADASALSDRSTAKLKQYLSDGGNALIVVGADPHSMQMRSLLNVSSAVTGQLSTGQSATDSSGNVFSPQNIGRVDDTHPLTATTSTNWRSLSVLRTLPLATDDSDRTLVALADGSPLLIERSIGEGRVLLLASALKSSWNNLAVNPLFVAFIVEAIEHLSGFDSENMDRSVGETITLPPGAQLLNPDGQPVRDLSDVNSKGRVFLDERGVYALRSATGTQVFAVNTHSLESDTRALDMETVVQWQANGNSAAFSSEQAGEVTNESATNVGASSTALLDNKQQLKSLWPWLLAMLLVLAMIETLYSHRYLRIKREA